MVHWMVLNPEVPGVQIPVVLVLKNLPLSDSQIDEITCGNK